MNGFWYLLNYALFYFISDYLIQKVDSGLSEKRLLNYLFDPKRLDAHNPLERPVSEDGKPVQVFLKCFLNQIMDMDEKNQILSTIIWLDLKWVDYHFQWNAKDFANIKQINLPPEKMWKPDIILYNSASEKFDQVFPVKVVVNNNGDMHWIPPGLFHSICEIEVNWFPFDSQNCKLKLGTWSYQGDTVDLKLQCDNETGEEQSCNLINEVDLSAYLAHSEWALESASIKRNVQTYGGPDKKYIDVTIYVHMQRRALYYMFNIIVPCMIMSVMALLVFTLPPDANEKIVLGVTTLLSLTMLLQLVADKLPQTSSGNPVLVLYFTCTMILCSLSLVCAVVLLNCHHHTGGIVYVPWWIETLINVWLANILRIDRPSETESPNVGKEHDTQYDQVMSPTKRLSQVTKAKIDDSELDSLSVKPPDYNSTVWSNVIDLNSEFRPCILIDRNQQSHVISNPCSNEEFSQLKNKTDHHQTKQLLSTQIEKSPLHPYLSERDDTESNSRLEYSCIQKPVFNKDKISSRYEVSELDNNHLQMTELTKSCDKIKCSKFSSVLYNSTPKFQLSFSDASEATQISQNVWTDTPYSSPECKPTSTDYLGDGPNNLLPKRLRSILKELRYITARIHREDQETRTSLEWRLACRVLDRLCLLVFAALNLFTTFGILTSAPTVIKAFTSRGAPSQAM